MNQMLSQHQIVDKKENKTTTAKKEKDRREGKGRVLAISRNVLYLLDSKDVYYVQSQHSSEIYYYVKYNADVFEWCSCKDNSTRPIKCKHLFAIEFAIKWGTIKDIDKIPSLSTTTSTTNKLGHTNLPYGKLGQTNFRFRKLGETNNNNNNAITNKITKSYLEDDYDF